MSLFLSLWNGLTVTYMICQHAQQRQTCHDSPTSSPATKKVWKPPDQPRCKMTVDAAISTRTQEVGIGAIIIDTEGQVMAALSSKFHGLLSPRDAEAKAILHSLHGARDDGLNL